MKEIELSQGKVTFVDDEIYDFLMQWKWTASKSRRTFYAQRAGRKGESSTVLIHRVVMEFFEGIQERMLVDHKDHDGLNNQYSNLHYVTHRGNSENRHDNKSGYPGVHYDTRSGRYRVTVCIGHFDTAEQAGFARALFLQRLEKN